MRLYETPALALPVVSKSEFVCPQPHLERLKQMIPNVERILVIGWRGAEKHFLSLLKDGLTKPVRILSVCGNSNDAADTNRRIREAGIQGTFFEATGGFSDLVANDENLQFIVG